MKTRNVSNLDLNEYLDEEPLRLVEALTINIVDKEGSVVCEVDLDVEEIEALGLYTVDLKAYEWPSGALLIERRYGGDYRDVIDDSYRAANLLANRWCGAPNLGPLEVEPYEDHGEYDFDYVHTGMSAWDLHGRRSIIKDRLYDHNRRRG